MTQTEYIELLLAERVVPETLEYRLKGTLAKGPMGKMQASDTIDWLKGQPKKVSKATGPVAPVELVKPGVYMHEGQIVVVKPTKDKKRSYALRLVETPDRLNEKGEVVPFEMVYVKGLIQQLQACEQMTLEAASSFLTRFGHCIACGRSLKAAKSVALSVGTVCIKKFA